MSNGYLKFNGNGTIEGRVITRQIDFTFLGKPTNSTNEKAPALELFAKSRSGAEFKIGVAYEKEMKDGKDKFFSMSFDDPALDAPLYVTAFPSKDGEVGVYEIVWQRPRKKEAA